MPDSPHPSIRPDRSSRSLAKPASWRQRAALPLMLSWAAIGSLAAIILRPLWGLPIRGHDTLLHFYRIPEINALLGQGILFSRWAPDLMLGYGYPLFNYYPPLSAYLLTGAYWLAGQNALVGLNLAFGLSLLLACAGMFLLARELYGLTGGLLAAAAYALSPHLLYQTFQRGSLSNALAMGLFPLAAFALVRAARAPGRRWAALAAVLLAAVLLSHTSASVLFAVPYTVLGLAVALATVRPEARRAALIRTALSVAGGLALAAFSWLPALSEIGYTQYAQAVASPGVDFRQHFAELLAWPEPLIAQSINPQLPKTPGVAQLALGCVALGAGLAGALARRHQRQGRNAAELPTIVAAVIGLGAALLATPAAAPLWEGLSLLRSLQYPWRLLDVSAFFVALACGRLARSLGGRSCLRSLVMGISLVAFFANAVPYTYPPRWRTLPARPSLADAAEAEVRYGTYGLTSWGEYAPAAAALRPLRPPFPGAAEGAPLASKLRRDMLAAGAVRSAEGGPLEATFGLSLAEQVTLTLETFYFPGWQAWVDGSPAPTGPDAEGRLSVRVPAGEHTVAVRFGHTPVRLASEGLSILAAGLIVAAVVAPRPHAAAQPVGPRPAVAPLPARAPVQADHRFAAAAAVLFGLLLCRLAWLDRFDSPLIHHLRNGTAPGLAAPPWGDFAGELRLLGYQLDEPDHLTLYWQAQKRPAQDYQVSVSLADARGIPAETIVNGHPGRYVASGWEAADVIRDEYVLPLDESLRPIGYRLSVSVIDPASGEKLPLLDGPDPEVRDVPLGTTRLAATASAPWLDLQQVEVTFGGVIELAGAWLSPSVSAGSVLQYALQWRSLAPVDRDYTVFVHLLRVDGTLAGTDDSQPRDGLYPTSYWSRGEIVAEERSWRPDVPPGEYLLEVGLYDLETGQRLSAAGQRAEPGDRVILGRIRVVG